MKRLIFSASMAMIIHALLMSVEVEWIKTRLARKKALEPLTISLHYQENLKKAEVPQKKLFALPIPIPPSIKPTPPAPTALDEPETPPFAVTEKAPKKKKSRIGRPKAKAPKRKEHMARRVAPVEDMPDDWIQIPKGSSHPVKEEAPLVASIASAKKRAAGTPERQKVAAPAPPPLVDAVPVYLKNPAPQYPRMARRRGYEGKVILDVLVNEMGKVEELRLFRSSGYQVLDRAAMNSVAKWVFEPGRRGNDKVDMWVKVPIRFNLKQK